VPVLTGVGHEIDLSLADAAAHTSFKTPTAAAEFLVARAQAARDAMTSARQRLAQAAAARLSEQQTALADVARRLPRAVEASLRDAEHGLTSARTHLRQRCRELLHDGERHLASARSRLVQGRAVETLVRLQAVLAGDTRRLAAAADRVLQHREEGLRHVGERLRLLDPRQVLSRGYAWLRRPDGAILKDAAAAREGEPLTGVLRDGEVELQTLAAHPRPAPPPTAPDAEQENP
jgi:exodeoxyribonuclease VII large subunit